MREANEIGTRSARRNLGLFCWAVTVILVAACSDVPTDVDVRPLPGPIDAIPYPANVVASGPGLTLTGTGVIRYRNTLPELNRQKVQGWRDQEGLCRMDFPAVIRPGDAPRFEGLAELDTIACIFVVAQYPAELYSINAGDASNRNATLLGDFGESQTEQEWQLPGSMALVQDSCTQIYDLVSALVHMYFEDPVNINVNESEHAINAHYNMNVCVTYMQSQHIRRWYLGSHWYPIAHEHYIVVDQDDPPQWMRAMTNSRFRNDWWPSNFCPTSQNPTYTEYWPNRIAVFSDGLIVAHGFPYAWGSCSYLLSPRRITFPQGI